MVRNHQQSRDRVYIKNGALEKLQPGSRYRSGDVDSPEFLPIFHELVFQTGISNIEINNDIQLKKAHLVATCLMGNMII